MSTAAVTPDRRARALPRFGGFSLTFLGLELRRMLRNRRTVIFTLILPPLFFLIFGSQESYRTESVGHGNVTAYILVSMAVYGAMLATTSGGATVAVERALGWSRQLRLTPLKPMAYVAIKVLVAMTLGLLAVAVVLAVGSRSGAEMDGVVWVESALIAWLGSVVFAAFGLFMGYLLPSENVMQILGPVLALLAILGGLWFPLDDDSVMGMIAKFTPMYGLAGLAHQPLVAGAFHISWLVNVVTWLVVFAAGAAWRFRKDTARV